MAKTTESLIDQNGFYIGGKRIQGAMDVETKEMKQMLSSKLSEDEWKMIYDRAVLGLQKEYAMKQVNEAQKHLSGKLVELVKWGKRGQYWVCGSEPAQTDEDLLVLCVKRFKDQIPFNFSISKKTSIRIVE